MTRTRTVPVSQRKSAALRISAPRRLSGAKFRRSTSFAPKLTEPEAAASFAIIAHPFSAGQLAIAAGRSKETAKNWKSGRMCPNGASLINMARSIPEIRAWLYAEIERGEEVDFDSPRMLHEINRKLSALMDRKG